MVIPFLTEVLQIEGNIIYLSKSEELKTLPELLLIDAEENALFINRDKNGTWHREKTFVSYLEVQYVDPGLF